jgi:hypothetical protein
MDLGVEDRDPLSLVGQDVGVGVGQPGDQPFEAEPAEVITHLAHRVRFTEQGGHLGAKAGVGEPGDGVHDRA